MDYSTVLKVNSCSEGAVHPRIPEKIMEVLYNMAMPPIYLRLAGVCRLAERVATRDKVMKA